MLFLFVLDVQEVGDEVRKFFGRCRQMRPNIFFLLICCFQQHIEVRAEEVLRQLEMYIKVPGRISYILVQLYYSRQIGLLLQMDAVLPRQHNPKGLFLLLTIDYHLAVARLEDMQREHHTWKEYDI